MNRIKLILEKNFNYTELPNQSDEIIKSIPKLEQVSPEELVTEMLSDKLGILVLLTQLIKLLKNNYRDKILNRIEEVYPDGIKNTELLLVKFSDKYNSELLETFYEEDPQFVFSKSTRDLKPGERGYLYPGLVLSLLCIELIDYLNNGLYGVSLDTISKMIPVIDYDKPPLQVVKLLNEQLKEMPDFSEQLNKIKDIHINDIENYQFGKSIKLLILLKKLHIENLLDNKLKFGKLNVEDKVFSLLLTMIKSINTRLDNILNAVKPVPIITSYSIPIRTVLV